MEKYVLSWYNFIRETVFKKILNFFVENPGSQPIISPGQRGYIKPQRGESGKLYPGSRSIDTKLAVPGRLSTPAKKYLKK